MIPNSSTNVLGSQLKPFVEVMMGASGLNEFEAINCVLFALATHLDLEEYPLLIFQGVAGSGKSSAMKQLFSMCKDAQWIQGKTKAAQIRGMKDGVRTAFIEEGDSIDTELFTLRFSKQAGVIGLNVPVGNSWEVKNINVFGATVMHRRVSIADVGLRSRSIVVRTRFKSGSYKYTPTANLSQIASQLQNYGSVGNNRIWQTWSPLMLLAGQLGLAEWQKGASKVIDKEIENLKGGQGYEPSEAILQTLDILSRKNPKHERQDFTARVSDAVEILRDEFSLNLKPYQIVQEINTGDEFKGFDIVKINGYKSIKIYKDVLDQILPEG